jgi:hypothetical protein
LNILAIPHSEYIFWSTKLTGVISASVLFPEFFCYGDDNSDARGQEMAARPTKAAFHAHTLLWHLKGAALAGAMNEFCHRSTLDAPAARSNTIFEFALHTRARRYQIFRECRRRFIYPAVSEFLYRPFGNIRFRALSHVVYLLAPLCTAQLILCVPRAAIERHEWMQRPQGFGTPRFDDSPSDRPDVI